MLMDVGKREYTVQGEGGREGDGEMRRTFGCKYTGGVLSHGVLACAARHSDVYARSIRYNTIAAIV